MLDKFIPLITTILTKEQNMVFIAGLIVGLIIGGLVGVFITPMFWKPKSGQ